MQHFLSLGEYGEWAVALGQMAEIRQLFARNQSAINPVDYNSNYEGGNFFMLFGESLKNNPTGLLDNIKMHLFNPAYRSYVR